MSKQVGSIKKIDQNPNKNILITKLVFFAPTSSLNPEHSTKNNSLQHAHIQYTRDYYHFNGKRERDREEREERERARER